MSTLSKRSSPSACYCTALSQADEMTCSNQEPKRLDCDNVNLNGDCSNIRMQDKIFFTLFAASMFISPFLAGVAPQSFYILHTLEACALLISRLRLFQQKNMQYFMYDFCYFIHLLLLIYLWLIPSGLLAGNLFMVLYYYANGPLLWAVPFWRDSFVFHSLEKMTSIFLHTSPSLVVATLRWNTAGGYTTCPVEQDGDICNLTFTAAIFNPVIFYIIWQTFYFTWVDMISKVYIEKNNLWYSYNWLVKHRSQSRCYRLASSCGQKWIKPLFKLTQFMHTIAVMLPCYIFYNSLEANILAIVFFMCVASWNGAQYYIDIFSENYHLQFKKSK